VFWVFRSSCTSIALPLYLLTGCSDQQTASTVEPPRTVDLDYRPELSSPAYPVGAGPVVCIDEAHNNFHTAVGTYLPFAELLRRDGYVVERSVDAISIDVLQRCGIYVIADAQPPESRGDPPTFAAGEIGVLDDWVTGGGSLFIITDHMPDPGAVADLAASFGIEVHNGYVLNGGATGTERPIVFSRADGTILDDPVTNGRSAEETVGVVATFTGSAFRAGEGFRPILVFGPERRSWMPDEYWRFSPNTPTVDVSGWLQGGVGVFGEGRLAFFAEAAMFTAQVFDQGGVRAGMNAPAAEDNAQLLLNVVHWLSGLL